MTLTPFSTRRVLLLTLAIHVIATGAGVLFVAQTFGMSAAGGFAMLGMVPVGVGVRICAQRGQIVWRDAALLGVLSLGVIIVGFGLGWRWYDLGMDRRFRASTQVAAFRRELRRDARFRAIEIDISGKPDPVLKGAVASEEDLLWLRTLASKYPLQWNEEIRVTQHGRVGKD